ncbi:hypothetical protein VCRA2110O318_40054 [Vibrio crassostreae]|nr:hypothetical protein VCRA2117O328_40053 [Vibrio crassostreae]CAK2335283.1 hypothetical protein VCRA2110O318_40054 [Vibrio crassostreae]CAK2503699.1 hypothetical protein VCRA2110O319_50054 [Vibrio crassostreae]CAK2910264.1 hypothetical protein VCRA217O317_30239 [Vibrio crassostreae]
MMSAYERHLAREEEKKLQEQEKKAKETPVKTIGLSIR